MFNHDNDNLQEALGIDADRFKDIIRLVIDAVHGRKKTSEIYEIIYKANLSAIENIVAGGIIDETRKRLMLKGMMGGLLGMLSGGVVPHECTNCGACDKSGDEEPELSETDMRRFKDIIEEASKNNEEE
jgi:hypothetical protein